MTHLLCPLSTLKIQQNRATFWGILNTLPNGVILNNIPFTFVNHDLRKISNDQMTTKVLIINTLSGHWSLVIFAFTLNLLHLPRVYGVTHSN